MEEHGWEARWRPRQTRRRPRDARRAQGTAGPLCCRRRRCANVRDQGEHAARPGPSPPRAVLLPCVLTRLTTDVPPSARNRDASPAVPCSATTTGASKGLIFRSSSDLALRLRKTLPVSETEFLRTSTSHIPQQRRMYLVAWVFYTLVLVALGTLVRPHQMRLNPAGGMGGGMPAFNPGPVGTAGTSQPKPAPSRAVKKPAASEASEMTRATAVSNEQPENSDQDSGAVGQTSGSGSGRVNLGTGAGLTLVKRVTPTYPRLMEQARMPGTVVLEAIIHRDGSIGDITLKSATNDAFAQAAMEAVKQWRYTPIPYEGIVTVTVNFTLPR